MTSLPSRKWKLIIMRQRRRQLIYLFIYVYVFIKRRSWHILKLISRKRSSNKRLESE